MTDQTVSIEIKAVKTAAPENDTSEERRKKEEKVNSMISRLESDKLAATTVLAEVKATTALSLNGKVIGLVVEECVSYISSTFPIFSVSVCVIISIMAASSSSC